MFLSIKGKKNNNFKFMKCSAVKSMTCFGMKWSKVFQEEPSDKLQILFKFTWVK